MKNWELDLLRAEKEYSQKDVVTLFLQRAFYLISAIAALLVIIDKVMGYIGHIEITNSLISLLTNSLSLSSS